MRIIPELFLLPLLSRHQDTWEYKTITFPADTTGALGNDANRSFAIRYCRMAAGSAYSSGTLQTTWGALRNFGSLCGLYKFSCSYR